jgi:LPXTG-motif cell wall-anchored protein
MFKSFRRKKRIVTLMLVVLVVLSVCPAVYSEPIEIPDEIIDIPDEEIPVESGNTDDELAKTNNAKTNNTLYYVASSLVILILAGLFFVRKNRCAVSVDRNKGNKYNKADANGTG